MNGIGDNLKRIRLLKNMSLKEAGKLLNMSATAITKYEKGQIMPNSSKIIEFANAYDVKTIDILKSYTPPEIQFNAFRKKKSLRGQNLELLRGIIQDEVSKYLEVIELTGSNNNLKLNKYKCSSLDDAEKIAIKFRNDYSLPNNQPISDLTNILENLGIIIIEINNINNRFDGFDGLSEKVNGIPLIIILNDMEDGARKRFTIAHELAHLLLDIVDNEVETEKLCNRFASALLMPKEAVLNEFGNTRNNISFYELISFKKEYKVSIAATLYRLKELNIISEYIYKKIIIYISKEYGKKNEPIKIVSEESYQFKKLVNRLVADSIISLNKACELLGVTLDEYNNKDNNYRY